jgi:hypothetical protein
LREIENKRNSTSLNTDTSNPLAEKVSNYVALTDFSQEIARPKYDTAMKSNVEIAKEVLEGKWGNGAERKEKLTKAGYNYTAVQNEVNKLVKKTKPLEVIAKEVIEGKWGNGALRKQRLKEAGYDPVKVQELVNKML